MLNNFEKFSFPSIEKRRTKDKETDGQKEKTKKKNNSLTSSILLGPFSWDTLLGAS